MSLAKTNSIKYDGSLVLSLHYISIYMYISIYRYIYISIYIYIYISIYIYIYIYLSIYIYIDIYIYRYIYSGKYFFRLSKTTTLYPKCVYNLGMKARECGPLC